MKRYFLFQLSDIFPIHPSPSQVCRGWQMLSSPFTCHLHPLRLSSSTRSRIGVRGRTCRGALAATHRQPSAFMTALRPAPDMHTPHGMDWVLSSARALWPPKWCQHPGMPNHRTSLRRSTLGRWRPAWSWRSAMGRTTRTVGPLSTKVKGGVGERMGLEGFQCVPCVARTVCLPCRAPKCPEMVQNYIRPCGPCCCCDHMGANGLVTGAPPSHFPSPLSGRRPIAV